MRFSEDDIDEVQRIWRRIRRKPTRDAGSATLAGVLDFTMEPPGLPAITDQYQVRLEVPLKGTQNLPLVFEEGGRIPRHEDNHVYPSGALCLGSPLRLLQVIGPEPCLLRFMTQCVVPFLYAASWRERGGIGFPFSELAHGDPGLVQDYEQLFGVSGKAQVISVLVLLALPRRVANKRPCPCGCGLRLGKCPLHLTLSPWRRLAPRWTYRARARLLCETDTDTKPVATLQQAIQKANASSKITPPA